MDIIQFQEHYQKRRGILKRYVERKDNADKLRFSARNIWGNEAIWHLNEAVNAYAKKYALHEMRGEKFESIIE